MDFAPVQKQNAAEQVADAIRAVIVRGELGAGDALPSERELAVQFGVNRSTVREAVKRLDAVGLVEVRQGGKTRVADVLASAGAHLLPFLLAPDGLVDGGLVVDLLELRAELLGYTGGRVARVPSDGLASALDAYVLGMDRAETAEERQRLDWSFFEALVAASGNRVLRILSGVIARVYEENQALFLALYESSVFHTEHHRALVDAVRQGDPVQGANAMRAYGRLALGGG